MLGLTKWRFPFSPRKAMSRREAGALRAAVPCMRLSEAPCASKSTQVLPQVLSHLKTARVKEAPGTLAAPACSLLDSIHLAQPKLWGKSGSCYAKFSINLFLLSVNIVCPLYVTTWWNYLFILISLIYSSLGLSKAGNVLLFLAMPWNKNKVKMNFCTLSLCALHSFYIFLDKTIAYYISFKKGKKMWIFRVLTCTRLCARFFHSLFNSHNNSLDG